MELLGSIAYVLLGRWFVARRAAAAFALLNVAALYIFFFYGKDVRFQTLFNLLFVVYVALVSFQYVTLLVWAKGKDRSQGRGVWLAFFTPLAILAVIRYAPLGEIVRPFPSIRVVLERHPEFTLGSVLVSYSYLAFRTSRLVLEVRNGIVVLPSYWEYLGFAIFAPTLSVGPINLYSRHVKAFIADDSPGIPVGQSLLRVLTGAVKFRFLGPILNELTYSGLLLDGHPHSWVDLPVAIVAYYLFLYCNFSGFCDIAIGGAGLMGIDVAENFLNPFAARNMKDFWNRWHITLSQYMRDLVFSPLSRTLVGRMGAERVNEAVAITIIVVFLLIGIWHGTAWNYAVFGLIQGVGVVGDLYLSTALKKRLGRDGFAAYNRNPWILAAARTLTFIFFACSLFFFANDGKAMQSIFAALRW
jgi:D-alanyl-lipoteichoic acid acyltransferase DltB (MBOAT superfamily)